MAGVRVGVGGDVKETGWGLRGEVVGDRKGELSRKDLERALPGLGD